LNMTTIDSSSLRQDFPPSNFIKHIVSSAKQTLCLL
jgi:hypothetical protein